MAIAVGKCELKKQGNALLWKNKTFSISLEEANEISADIKKYVQSGGVSLLVVDNRAVGNGVWSAEVNTVWEQLMGFLAGNIGKCATLCAGATNKMQLNRLSRSAGTFEKIQAFTEEAEALSFLGLSNLPN
ncbi:MAG: hypothetical protein ACXVP2_13030 [Tumebacillaceae bacterium]